MSNRKQAFIGFGANLGDRLTSFREAKALLEAEAEVAVVQVSPIYQSEAHVLDEDTERFAYLNAVVEVQTTLLPEALLEVCLGIERRFGRDRDREARWAPRTLDLDVLVYGREERQTKRLLVPHPRIGERLFVLRPLMDIAPDLWLPAPYQTTVAALLARCPDTTTLTHFSTAW